MSEAEVLLARWRDEGEHRLASFTSEELVAVGADSPLQGLVISERLVSMGPIPLTAALSTALRGLVARGFVHPEGASSGGAPTADRQLQRLLAGLADRADAEDDEEDEEDGSAEGDVVSVPLSGDLAVVVALRRAPALVCLVSEPSRHDLTRRGPLAHRRTDAILHGFTAEDAHLGGFLEERRSALGVHSFVLRSLDEETRALCAGLATRAGEPFGGASPGGCELALEVAAPEGPGRGSVRLLVALEPGDGERARISWPGGPGTPASETTTAEQLPRRLAELLERLWRGDGGAACISAS